MVKFYRTFAAGSYNITAKIDGYFNKPGHVLQKTNSFYAHIKFYVSVQLSLNFTTFLKCGKWS